MPSMQHARARRRAHGRGFAGAALGGLGLACRAAVCLAAVCLGIAAPGLACTPRAFAGDPATSGDDPSLNRATSSRVKDVPYCQGGQRDTDCLFGANCRVTEAGCQVCQCLSPP